MSDGFDVVEISWQSARPALEDHFECTVKTRYRQTDLACRVHLESGGRAQVRLREPARAVTPGQYAVFYDGEVCLGGGVIERRRNSRTADSGGAPAAGDFTYN
jgi:tRNA-specific 2-thiouridylase